MKVMAKGKHNVKISAGKRLKSPALKPYLRFHHTALWTAPVLARVAQDYTIMPFGALINVKTLVRRTTRHHVPCSPSLPLTHWMLTLVNLKVITKYFLYDPCLHLVPALSSIRPCTRATSPQPSFPQTQLPSHPTVPNCVTPAESSLLVDLISLIKTPSLTASACPSTVCLYPCQLSVIPDDFIIIRPTDIRRKYYIVI